MQRILTNQLPAHLGERVRLAGWLQQRRELSRVTFLVLRDARGLAQIVVEDDAAGAFLPETVMAVEGDAVAAPQAKTPDPPPDGEPPKGP